MRELKFRLWNKKDKEWENPAIVEVFGSDGILRPLYNDDNGGDWKNKYEINQYTGLKDKHGKEIYEGDIVNVSRCHTVNVTGPTGVVKVNLVEDGEELGYVYWFETLFEYTVSFDHLRYDDNEKLFANSSRYEVMGNIYENPDLVKYGLT